MRIGELLPPAEETRGQRTDISPPSDKWDVPKDDLHKFRLLAEYRPLVEELIEEGYVTRGKILAAGPPLIR